LTIPSTFEEMNKAIIVGLPRMDTPIVRDFLPPFVTALHEFGASVWIEPDYGHQMGVAVSDYPATVHSREEIFTGADIVLQLTAPSEHYIDMMHEGQTLISMLHFPTHSARNSLLRAKGVTAVSLDSMTDDQGARVVEDLRRTAHNGIRAGFAALRNVLGDQVWFSPKRPPVWVYLMGHGAVGHHAVDAIFDLGGQRTELIERKGNPAVQLTIATSAFSLNGGHGHKLAFQNIPRYGCLCQPGPEVVVDATLRRNPTEHILQAEHLCKLSHKAVIIDLDASCYTDAEVKGIQGIPTGGSEQYLFLPDDPAYELVPAQYRLPRGLRPATVVSHYSWPSFGTQFDWVTQMSRYGTQILPYLAEMIGPHSETLTAVVRRATL